MAIDGARIVVGAVNGDGVVSDSGSAYVFDAASGQLLHKLTASDGGLVNQFGCGVAIDGDRIVAGAPYDDDLGAYTGSAYVFDALTGQELFKLTASNGAAGDFFGRHVAIDGDPVAVGASGTGTVHVFDARTGREFHALQTGGGTNHGWGPAVRGELVVVGDPNASSGAAGPLRTPQYLLQSGAARVYSAPLAPGAPFCFGDGGGSGCPCANGAQKGAGCANSSGTGGQLVAAGSASVAADDLLLAASQLVRSQPALLYAGVNAIQGGDGVPFGDGLRCAGMNVVRLGVELPAAGGEATWGPGLVAAGGWAAGDTRYLQVWYRDPGGPCGTGFNLTNGIELTFIP